MNIKARISVEGIPVGTITATTLECGSGIHTYDFRFNRLFSILKFPSEIAHKAISALGFVAKELEEDMKIEEEITEIEDGD
jgi:hypothetical protein